MKTIERTNELQLINAVEEYLKLTCYESYIGNDLETVFKQARKNGDYRFKMLNIIEKFILEQIKSVENLYEIDKTYNNLISNGEVSVCEPITEPWGQRTCYIADLEGKLTEVV